ncbi:WGR domain-containing protein, partial [Microvirga sp. BT688]|uniref:WGR domain-containing protein n=1 Tax=Microvirga sp. TaxID=1873136 RepID=UPI001684354E
TLRSCGLSGPFDEVRCALFKLLQQCRIGTIGQEKTEEFTSEDAAGKALQALAQAMRRQGYRDL